MSLAVPGLFGRLTAGQMEVADHQPMFTGTNQESAPWRRCARCLRTRTPLEFTAAAGAAERCEWIAAVLKAPELPVFRPGGPWRGQGFVIAGYADLR